LTQQPTIRITAEAIPKQAFQDLLDGLLEYELWTRFAIHDIRQRFRRSAIGPLWITLSMGVMIATMGFVFSGLFHQSIGQILPYITVGIIFWGLLTSCINEGASVFVAAESFIRNVPVPISVHFYRMIARNLMIWLFNMVIYVLILLIFGILPNSGVVWFIPGFLIFMLNAIWMSLAVAVISTRFRDVPQLITNLIQVVFFLTPIFWSPETMPGRPAFIYYNPGFHLLEIVRAPLLGVTPHGASLAVCSAMAVLGLALTYRLYRRAHGRISYWV
jgi:ABC-type polysaccharide/polyol phosphate export permease